MFYKIQSNEKSYIKELFYSIFDDNLLAMSSLVSDDEISMTKGAHFNSSVHRRFAQSLVERYYK
jgi:hypothetical protein